MKHSYIGAKWVPGSEAHRDINPSDTSSNRRRVFVC
ncbi:hypothetical protein LMG27174_05196 [Paraburkholderia rhynchosiae]|uniref:Uncharacterized protein n=1 Tax=Paraburkholderia rhynchosiae TaxID=487049 RepID=A0A6J5C3G8_9BURK|nr:hypothetical protein LMG27174_05196 [Paraburkholderia rhynchosiae]